MTRVSESVLAMRLALCLCEAATIAAVIGLLRLTGRRSTRVVAYAWHPLPVWEIANNGHVDGLTVALMMAGLWLALAGRQLPGAVVIALAALAKPFALLALPPLWRPWNWRMVATVAAVLALAYVPYLSVGGGVFGFLGSGYLAEQGLESGAGFWLVRVWRSLVGPTPGETMVYLAASGMLVVALALRAGLRRETDGATRISDVTTLLVAFLILLSSEYPWYQLLLVPFLALSGRPVGWALTVGAFVFYDVVQGDAVVPFYIRAGLFNVTVGASLAYEWRVRSAEGVR